jgi:hypothetical protein
MVFIFTWFYLFNIYEIKISVNPKSLSIDANSRIEIDAIPLNSFGTRAYLRNITAKFEILSGDNLIRIEKKSQNSIFVYSKEEKGNAEILVTPSIGMFPSKIEITIGETEPIEGL